MVKPFLESILKSQGIIGKSRAWSQFVTPSLNTQAEAGRLSGTKLWVLIKIRLECFLTWSDNIASIIAFLLDLLFFGRPLLVLLSIHPSN